MCLIIDPKVHVALRYKVAKKDIVCYKMLIFSCNSTYITPFQKVLVDTNNPIFKSDMFQKKPINVNFSDNVYMIVHGIHTYTEKFFTRRHKKGFSFFKCIIPKGTKYWISFDNNELCSEEIKFLYEVESNTLHFQKSIQ